MLATALGSAKVSSTDLHSILHMQHVEVLHILTEKGARAFNFECTTAKLAANYLEAQ